MAKLKWGLPKIEVCKLVNGEIPAQNPTWIEFKNPVEDTTKLTAADGKVLEAPIEGGEIFAKKRSANKYSLEVELYANDDVSKPIEDANGVINDEYAVRLTPEDASLKGFILEKTSVSLQESFDAQIGQKWKYVFDGLKPKAGNILKPYTAG